MINARVAILLSLLAMPAVAHADFTTDKNTANGNAEAADKNATEADRKAQAAKAAEKAAAEAEAKKAHDTAAQAHLAVAKVWRGPTEGPGARATPLNVTFFADALNAAYDQFKKAGKTVDAESAEKRAADALMVAADAASKAGDANAAKPLYDRAQSKYTNANEAAKATAAGKKAADLAPYLTK